MSQPRTILVIDASPMARRTLSSQLEYYGYSALAAGSAAEGLKLLKEKEREIGLVILDLTLPGIPPEKMLAALRTLAPKVKVAVSTEQNTTDIKYQQTYAQVVGVLRKPLSTDRVLALLRKVVEN